jgi:hypothetical protein
VTPMFYTLAQVADIDQYHTKRWWKALSASKWSTPRSWQQALILFDSSSRTMEQLDRVLPFLNEVSPPGRVMRVVEALWRERLLTRSQAGVLEDKILACVGKDGEWKYDTIPQPRIRRHDHERIPATDSR